MSMPGRPSHKTLWILQGLLALIFVVAGVLKLILPTADLTAQTSLPAAFLRFVAVCEVLGALGLVLPGLTGIRPGLTVMAAAGLVVIMVGATITASLEVGVALGAFPAVVGLLSAYVAYGRSTLSERGA